MPRADSRTTAQRLESLCGEVDMAQQIVRVAATKCTTPFDLFMIRYCEFVDKFKRKRNGDDVIMPAESLEGLLSPLVSTEANTVNWEHESVLRINFAKIAVLVVKVLRHHFGEIPTSSSSSNEWLNSLPRMIATQLQMIEITAHACTEPFDVFMVRFCETVDTVVSALVDRTIALPTDWMRGLLVAHEKAVATLDCRIQNVLRINFAILAIFALNLVRLEILGNPLLLNQRTGEGSVEASSSKNSTRECDTSEDETNEPPEADESNEPPEADESNEPPEADESNEPPEADESNEPPEAEAMKPEESKKKHLCSECDLALYNLAGLSFHLSRKHPEEYAWLNRFTCADCYLGFPERTIFIDHIQREHGSGDINKFLREPMYPLKGSASVKRPPEEAEVVMTQSDQEENSSQGEEEEDLFTSTASTSAVLSRLVHTRKNSASRFVDIRGGGGVRAGGRLRCPECDERFKQKQTLTVHFKRHHPEEYKRLCRFFCPACDDGFSSYDDVKAHIQRQHPGERSLNARIIEIDDDERARGSENGKPSSEGASSQRAEHAEVAMMQSDPEGNSSQDAALLPTTASTSAVTSSRRERVSNDISKFLRKPIYRVQRGGRRQCPACDKGFRFKHGLTLHIKYYHPAVYKRLTRFVCSACRAGFTSHDATLTHICTVHEVKGVIARAVEVGGEGGWGGRPRCPVCYKGLRFKRSLSGHVNRAHPSAYKRLSRFFCPICDAGFITHNAAMAHIYYVHKVSRAVARVFDIDGDRGATGSENGKQPPVEASEGAEDAEVAMMQEDPEEDSSHDAASTSTAPTKRQHNQREQGRENEEPMPGGTEEAEIATMKEVSNEEEDSSPDAASTSTASEKRQHKHIEQTEPRTSLLQKRSRPLKESRELNNEPPTAAHMLATLHDNQGRLRCLECDEGFHFKEHLTQNIKLSHPEVHKRICRYLCTICREYFMTRSDAQSHIHHQHEVSGVGARIVKINYDQGARGSDSNKQPLVRVTQQVEEEAQSAEVKEEPDENSAQDAASFKSTAAPTSTVSSPEKRQQYKQVKQTDHSATTSDSPATMIYTCPECHASFDTRALIVLHIYGSHAMLNTLMLIKTVFDSGKQETTTKDRESQQGDSSDDKHKPTWAKRRREEKE